MAQRSGFAILGLAGVAVSSLLVTLALGSLASRGSAPGFRDLVESAPDPRPFAARFSGGFRHAPCPTWWGAGEDTLTLRCHPEPAEHDRRRAAALDLDLKRSLRFAPEARRRHQLAVASFILRGARADRQEAASELETAARLSPDSPEIWSDLAAAYLARADQVRDAADLLRALDAAEQALALQPGHPEGLWNQLVIASSLSRPLTQDLCRKPPPVSDAEEWLAERQELCRRQEGPTVGQQLLLLRRQLEIGTPWQEALASAPSALEGDLAFEIETELLPRWAQAVEQGEERRAKLWGEAVATGSTWLLARTGDQALSCLVALGSGDISSSTVQRLAAGVTALQTGIQLDQRGNTSEARAALILAEQRFEPSCPALGAVALFHRVRSHFRAQDSATARSLARRGLEQASAGAWRNLEARFATALGTARFAVRQSSQALPLYRVALRQLADLHDPLAAAYVHVRAASVLRELGEPRLAAEHRLAALRAVRFREDRREAVEALAESAYAAHRLGLPWAASRLARTELALAIGLADPLYLQLALRHQLDFPPPGSTEEKILSTLAAARLAIEPIASPATRGLLHGYLDLAEARALQAAQPDRSLERLQAALAGLARNQQSQLYLAALDQRADLLSRLGKPAAAIEDLERALAAIEPLRADRTHNLHRVALHELLGKLSRKRLRLALADGAHPEQLLAIEEVGRARLVLDWLSRPGGLGPIGPGEIPPASPAPSMQSPSMQGLRRSLGEDEALVEYASLDDSLLIWVIDRDGGHFEQVPWAPAKGLSESPEALYDQLIRPVRPVLEGRRALYLSPDSPLSAVPFSSLRDRETGRSLVEDFALAVVPSFAVLEALPAPAQPAVTGDRSLLLVADPQIDPFAHPSLQRLPRSLAETQAVAGLFPGSETLVRDAATRSRVLQRLNGHWGLHFAAHAILPEDSPLDPRLVLAAPAADAGADSLSPEDLLGVDARRVRFVFLAACASGTAHWPEAAPGLAWPLLAAGVPQVVATVTAVADDATSELVLAFYARLAESGDVAAALRQTQLSCLEAAQGDERRRLFCGSFQLYGRF